MKFKGIQVPFELVPFSEMNKKQAKQYFEWFIETIDERLVILQEYITSTGGDFVLDKTPESLIPLWEWFVDKIEMIPKSEEDIKTELDMLPERFRNVVDVEYTDFSEESFLLLYNISIYFGEVIVKNNLKISWGYLTTPKRLHGVNSPRLLGFAGDMSSYVFGKVKVCFKQDLKKHTNIQLFELYKLHLDMM